MGAKAMFLICLLPSVLSAVIQYSRYGNIPEETTTPTNHVSNSLGPTTEFETEPRPSSESLVSLENNSTLLSSFGKLPTQNDIEYPNVQHVFSTPHPTADFHEEISAEMPIWSSLKNGTSYKSIRIPDIKIDDFDVSLPSDMADSPVQETPNLKGSLVIHDFFEGQLAEPFERSSLAAIVPKENLPHLINNRFDDRTKLSSSENDTLGFQEISKDTLMKNSTESSDNSTSNPAFSNDVSPYDRNVETQQIGNGTSYESIRIPDIKIDDFDVSLPSDMADSPVQETPNLKGSLVIHDVFEGQLGEPFESSSLTAIVPEESLPHLKNNRFDDRTKLSSSENDTLGFQEISNDTLMKTSTESSDNSTSNPAFSNDVSSYDRNVETQQLGNGTSYSSNTWDIAGDRETLNVSNQYDDNQYISYGTYAIVILGVASILFCFVTIIRGVITLMYTYDFGKIHDAFMMNI